MHKTTVEHIILKGVKPLTFASLREAQELGIKSFRSTAHDMNYNTCYQDYYMLISQPPISQHPANRSRYSHIGAIHLILRLRLKGGGGGGRGGRICENTC